MIKSRLGYLKWTAVVAVLGIAVVAGVRTSTATKQPAPVASAPASADLASEERVLAKYFDDLVAYQNEYANLSKRPVLEHIHINPFQVKSDDLKRRLPEAQNVIREIVRKLKAAKEWDDLDTTIAAKVTDGTSNTIFRQESLKQLLEESSNNLSSHGDEITIPLANLRKKLTSRNFSPDGNRADVQIVRAGYEAPAPMKFVSLRCSIGKIRMGVAIKLGRLTDDTVNRVAAACGVSLGPTPF